MNGLAYRIAISSAENAEGADMLRFAKSTLKILNVANWIVGIAIIALFAV